MDQKEYDAITPNGRDPYGPAFFKACELDHGPASEAFGQVLSDLYHPKTAIEFGCGTGGTMHRLMLDGVEVTPTDFTRDAQPFLARRSPALAESFTPIDLSCKQTRFKAPYDLAICIEVLEHLPPEAADTAVETIAASATRAVVTACPPTQRTVERARRGDTLHLNEQPFAYWVEKFNANGMLLDVEDTAKLKQIMRALGSIKTEALPVVPAWYFSSYIGVFRREI